MSTSARRIFIGVLLYIGMYLMLHGADENDQSKILAGMLLMSFGLGIVVSSRRTTVLVRAHCKAIWRAGWILYLFRRLK